MAHRPARMFMFSSVLKPDPPQAGIFYCTFTVHVHVGCSCLAKTAGRPMCHPLTQCVRQGGARCSQLLHSHFNNIHPSVSQRDTPDPPAFREPGGTAPHYERFKSQRVRTCLECRRLRNVAAILAARIVATPAARLHSLCHLDRNLKNTAVRVRKEEAWLRMTDAERDRALIRLSRQR